MSNMASPPLEPQWIIQILFCYADSSVKPSIFLLVTALLAEPNDQGEMRHIG